MDFTAYSVASLVLLFLLVWNARTLTACLGKVRKRTWIILSCVLLVICFVCWFLVPNTHRTFGDEPNELSKIGMVGGEYSGLTIQTYLYYFIYQYIKPSNLLLIKVNIFLAMLCLVILFLLVRTLFQDDVIALISIVTLGVSEPFIIESTTAYTPIIGLLFGLLACLCFWLFLVSRRITLLLAALISVCFAAVCRIEYVVLCPLFFSFMIFQFFGEKKKRWLLGILECAVFAIACAFLFFAFMHQNIRSKRLLWQNEQGWGIVYLPHSFKDLFLPQTSHLLLLFLFLLSLSWFWTNQQKKFKESIFLLASLALFSFFYMCNIYYAPRFLVVLVAMGSFVSGITARLLLDRLKRNGRLVAITLLLIIILFSLSHTVQRTNQWAEKNSYTYMTSAAPTILHRHIDKSCLIVVSYRPNVAMAYDLNAMDAQQAIGTPDLLEKNSCTYFFEDYLCEYIEEYTGMKKECDIVKQKFNLVPELIISDTKGRDYTLYRIHGKGIANPASPTMIYVYPLTGISSFKSMIQNTFSGFSHS